MPTHVWLFSHLFSIIVLTVDTNELIWKNMGGKEDEVPSFAEHAGRNISISLTVNDPSSQETSEVCGRCCEQL